MANKRMEYLMKGPILQNISDYACAWFRSLSYMLSQLGDVLLAGSVTGLRIFHI